MRRLKLLLHLCAVLAAVAPSAFAKPDAKQDLWLKEEFTFGASSYKSNSLGLYRQISTAVVMGGEFNFYKSSSFDNSVYSVRLPLYIYGKNHLTFLRPFYYPTSKGVDGSAGGLFLQNVFGFSEGKDAASQLSFNVGYANQRSNLYYTDGGGGEMGKIPELSYELQFQQGYFREFYLLFTGAAYQYLHSVKRVVSPKAVMDQSELASLGLLGGTTKLPKWTCGVELTRGSSSSDDENDDSSLFAGYHFIEYENTFAPSHSLSAGMRLKISDNSNMDFTYNWVASGDSTKENFYRFALRAAF